MPEALALIRSHSDDIATHLQWFTEALSLATREPVLERSDPTTVLRSVAEGARLKFVGESERRAAPAAEAPIDHEPALVAFVARAFLDLVRSVRSPTPAEVHGRVRRDADFAIFELRCSETTDHERQPAALVDGFLRGGESNAGRIARSALRAAAALVELRGGALEFLGSPDRGATSRMRLPSRSGRA